MASKNVETLKAANQAFNRRDFDAVVSSLAEECTYHDRARDLTYRGRNGFREFLEGWVKAFSDAEVTEETYLDAGDVVITQFVGAGVNDGPLGALPATGKKMKTPFCEISRFNEWGQIVSGEIYYDQLSILVQLGHLQAPQMAAAA